ncbi:MAG TPA: alanine racemase [Longimicrobiales bacterium]|nr:alanine racemase [Longimicrobiales bacterium]
MLSNGLRDRAWVEVDTGALRANYRRLHEAVGGNVGMIPMIKADGYGLGAEWVARSLESFDPVAFGVAAAHEGRALRAAGVERPIIVFTPLTHEALETAAQHRLIPALSDVSGLERWLAINPEGPFHVEIDTGMGRAGFDWRETAVWGERLRAAVADGARCAGVFTHFHGADSADPAPAAAQWQRFRDALAQLPVSTENLLVHACNSAAALRWPEYAADAIRPGIFLYGGHPASEVSGAADLRPEPVVSVRARVVLVRDVPPGSTVGYGATHAARGWERWATLPIGYGDGWPRALGNAGQALIRGRRVRIVGRISMDMTVVDVTGVPEVTNGDVATFIGSDGEEDILVDDVAEQVGTISYEILTGLTSRLPRIENDAGLG